MNQTSSDGSRAPCRLTIFAFLWACQALAHQEFYSKWLLENNVIGWTLTISALATLLWPRSLLFFSIMLVSSVAQGIANWPFVSNHILVESLIHFTILGAIAATAVTQRHDREKGDNHSRDEIFDRFAPVARTTLVVLYYFAFIAKLNSDFFRSDASCVVAMFRDLTGKIPFLPETPLTIMIALWLTLIVEAAIPIFLTFRRTQPLAIIIGLLFHIAVGWIGHRTFSALAFALYALFLMESLTAWAIHAKQMVTTRWGHDTVSRCVAISRAVITLGVIVMIGGSLTGNHQSRLGPLSFARAATAVWACWSIVVAAVYLAAIRFSWKHERNPLRLPRFARPGLLWLVVPVMILNGMSQYLGLKTKTSFTMYSNLRTEGGKNNHLFMPTLRLADYQDDLVDVIETDLPELQRYLDQDLLITYFEFRRITSNPSGDFYVTYLRQAKRHRFALVDGVSNNAELSRKHPIWQAKLLYFRPVDKGEHVCCRH